MMERQRPSTVRGRGRPPFVLAGTLAALLLGVMVFSWVRLRGAASPLPADSSREPRSAPPGGADRYASMTIPGFTLMDQDGRQHTKDIFNNRWTILAFTFTNCPTACPIMNSNLIRVQELLKGTAVRTVSITVDPAHDTPEALKAHAAMLGIDESRWTFLTGEPGVINSIVKGLRFDLTEDPALVITLADGSTMSNIVHPTRLLLIGPDGSVRAMESGLDWDSTRALAERAMREVSPSNRP